MVSFFRLCFHLQQQEAKFIWMYVFWLVFGLHALTHSYEHIHHAWPACVNDWFSTWQVHLASMKFPRAPQSLLFSRTRAELISNGDRESLSWYPLRSCSTTCSGPNHQILEHSLEHIHSNMMLNPGGWYLINLCTASEVSLLGVA